MPRRNPFEEIERMLDEMSRQFESFEPERLTTGAGDVRVDIEDRGDEFVVTADLPGFAKEDIDVELADTALRISAEREEAEEAETGTYVRRERRGRSVSRSLSLPEEVDEEDTSASYTNGVLTITLPKRSGEESESIPID